MLYEGKSRCLLWESSAAHETVREKMHFLAFNLDVY